MVEKSAEIFTEGALIAEKWSSFQDGSNNAGNEVQKKIGPRLFLLAWATSNLAGSETYGLAQFITLSLSSCPLVR